MEVLIIPIIAAAITLLILALDRHLGESEKSRVYIAGPMRGLPDYNYPSFHKAAREWRASGFEVVSPAELDLKEERRAQGLWARLLRRPTRKLDFPAYLRRDLRELSRCDAIALLPGWQDSQGALFELQAALLMGLMVYNADFSPYPTGFWRPPTKEVLWKALMQWESEPSLAR